MDKGSGGSKKPLHNNTKQSNETNIHARGDSRTRNPSKPAATDYALDRAATGTGQHKY